MDVRAEPLHAPASYAFPREREGCLPWAHAEANLERAKNYWLVTNGSGRVPHVTPVWGVWLDGSLYFDGLPTTRWAKNIADNPNAGIHLESAEDVVILEGTAEDLSATDPALGERIVAAWDSKYGKLIPRPVEDGIFRFRARIGRGWSTSTLTDGARWHFSDR